MKHQTIKHKANYLIVLAIGLCAAIFSPVQAHDDELGANCATRQCRRDLASARMATARYHYFQNALDDGFVQASPCVAVPGLGAMGFHFVNFARAGNPNLDIAEPETLLYIPDEEGEMRLVGLEYVRFGPPMPPAPVLFQQNLHYDSNLGAYTLHVWAWRHNPSGTFAPFNPSLSCPQS